jgi:hypothetical protein
VTVNFASILRFDRLRGQHTVNVEQGFNHTFDFGHAQNIGGFDFPIPFTCCSSPNEAWTSFVSPPNLLRNCSATNVPATVVALPLRYPWQIFRQMMGQAIT